MAEAWLKARVMDGSRSLNYTFLLSPDSQTLLMHHNVRPDNMDEATATEIWVEVFE